jgi:uncharacterized protein
VCQLAVPPRPIRGQALKLFRLSAEKGFPPALYNLANCHLRGEGVPQDFVQAYVWFDLALGQGYSGARRAKDKVAERMTPSEIKEAERLTKEWRQKMYWQTKF